MDEEINIDKAQVKKLGIILLCLTIGFIIGYFLTSNNNEYDIDCMVNSVERMMNNTGDLSGGYWDDNITMSRLRFGYEIQNIRAQQVLTQGLTSTLRKCKN